MAVKQVKSTTRVLAVFEAVARHQPVGVGALARAMDDDKSGVQRALVTLADAGWIRRSTVDGARWELTTRALRIAHEAYQRTGLHERTRPTLERLRNETGETVILNVPEDGKVVILDIAESLQMLRTVPVLGFVVPIATSAAALAILAHLPPDQVEGYLGAVPDRALLKGLATVRDRGWSVNDRDAAPGASVVGAVVLDSQQRPIVSITISGPADRMGSSVLDELGPIVAAAASALSAH